MQLPNLGFPRLRQRFFILSVLALLVAPAAWGQRGDAADNPGHSQRPPSFPIPPSPALSPEDALKTFRAAPGFRVELVASEPLVEDPVAIAFDPDGRIWAVEMRGWMNDVDGAGNNLPIGRIVTLEDTNGDGRMDRSTVFMDGLVMPRAVQLARDGVLIAAPPHLWFCRDTDGDGRADERQIVADDYMNFPNPQANPEADPNGLLWNIDNWLYSARYSVRIRYRDGEWQRQPAAIGGQWGLSQDDYGRHFFNSNQDQLRANPLPGHYASRNPHLYRPAGWNVQVSTDQGVWPIRVSPAANRGYRSGVLRPDGTLRIFEAACGPAIYRGGLFPGEFSGNAFVADPVAHIVKRNIVSESQGGFRSEHAYVGHEFLASTDERFRPVNLYTGPEGALYVVDMYRGIIEYIHVMTSYLRRQIVERKLDRPLGRGRIYRIVPTTFSAEAAPKLSALIPAQLVRTLADPNGWRREIAQRLLVERADESVVPDLNVLARSAPQTWTRLHALWTLEGMNRLGSDAIMAALDDPSEKIRAAAGRLSEPWLRQSLDSVVSRCVLAGMDDPAAVVLLQLALSLGEATAPAREEALLRLALQRGHPAASVHPYMAGAIVSGLRRREAEFLDQFLSLPGLKAQPPGAENLLEVLAGAILGENSLARLDRLFAHVADDGGEPSWVRLALIRGMASRRSQRLQAYPVRIADWDRIADPGVRAAALQLAATIAWPGKSGERPAPAELTPVQRERAEVGRTEYVLCASCHLPTGQGMPGLSPALVNSRWAVGRPEPLVRIVLHGKHEYTDHPPMPPLSNLEDEKIAAILTYIRREWGHSASAVDPELVARVRQETQNRERPWTRDELERIGQVPSP